jgi:cell division protein FtsW (lipid II flippase)
MRLHERISKKAFLAACVLLLLPTTINETKGTLVLLPIGLFVALLVGSPRGRRLRVATVTLALLVGFGAIYVPVYDFFMQNARWETSIVDFVTEEGKLERYLEKDGAGVGATESKSVGRGDVMRISVEYVSRDAISFAFGLGLGSVTDSSLGESFSGPYYRLFEHINKISFSTFVLEIGFLGVATVFLLYWLIFQDTLAVARNDQGLPGSISIGWAGVVAVMTIATFYKTIHTFESLSYLFWYFSGLVAARRMQLSNNGDEIRRQAST